MKIQGVVFDLDHTLFDRYATIRSYVPALYQAIGQWIEEGVAEEEFGEAFEYADRRLNCYGWWTMMGLLQEMRILKKDVPMSRVISIIQNQFQAVYAEPFSFGEALLKELRGMGLKLGLITNGYADIQQRKIDLLGITPLMDEILIGGAFGKQKPDPAIFAEMARRLDAEPGRLLYVGDHPLNDYQGSKNAGYTPVLVKPSGFFIMPEAADAEYTVNNVAELPELIRRNQWR